MVSSLLVSKHNLQYKLSVHLRLNVFNDETNLIRTELGLGDEIYLRLHSRPPDQYLGVFGQFGGGGDLSSTLLFYKTGD